MIDKEKFIKAVDTVTGRDISLNQIDDDLSSMGVDSIDLIRLIVVLEDEFNIVIPDECLNVTNMKTLNKIISVIESIS